MSADQDEREDDVFSEFWKAYDSYTLRLGKFIDADKRIIENGGDRETDKAWLGRNVSREVTGEWLHASAMACFMSGLDKYLEGAAKDRESAESNRRAQKAQTWAMVALTFVIAVSTALYTVAAWRTIPSPPAAITAPAGPQSPQPPRRDP